MSMATTAQPRHTKQSLARTMLFTLLLLTLAPLLFMGSLAYLRARTLLREQAFELLAAAAESQGQQLEAQASTGRALMAQAVASANVSAALQVVLSGANPQGPEFSLARQQIFDGLQSYIQPDPFFNQFVVLLPNGQVHISTRPEWEGAALSDPAYQADLAGEPASQALYGLAPLYKQSFLLLSSVPVLDSQGQLAATILGITESPAVRARMDSTIFYSDRHYFVTPAGEFIGLNPSPTSPERLVLLPPSDAQRGQIFEPLRTGVKHGVQELSSFENEPVIAAYAWMPELKTAWVAEVPQTRVYGPIDSLLILAVLLFLGTAMLMTGALWATIRYLVQPLTGLTQVVQGFTGGDWSQRARVARQDEVGLLSHAFNRLAEDLVDIHHSLETKVEARTKQISTAADVSQIAISSATPAELLTRTLELVRERFYLPYAAIFQIDDSGQNAVLRQAMAPQGQPSPRTGLRLHVDVSTPIGKTASANRSFSEKVLPGSGVQREDLLPTATMEGCVPIAVGARVLAVLQVQDTTLGGLDEETLAELQTIANLIAPALQSFNLQESTQINLQETRALYQASHQVAQASTVQAVLDITRHALRSVPYASLLLVAEVDGFRKTFDRTPGKNLPEWISLPPAGVYESFPPDGSAIITDLHSSAPLPKELIELGRKMQCESLAFIPILRGRALAGLVILGVEEKDAGKRILTATALQPYTTFITLVNTTIEKNYSVQHFEKRAAEMHSLDVISTAISVETEVDELYRVLHQQLNVLMGQVDFFIAHYDKENQLIHVPYMVEKDAHLHIDPFPLGEGLTSILIKTCKPLLLVHDTERVTVAMGAKIIKGRAKSWLGVPMLLNGEPVGALVVQDLEHEGRFTEDDQRLLTTVAGQVAVAVRNVALLASTRQQAENERLLFDISTKIRRTTDMQRILQITAEELGKALRLRRTRIQLQLKEEPRVAFSPAGAGLPEDMPPPNPDGSAAIRRNGDEA